MTESDGVLASCCPSSLEVPVLMVNVMSLILSAEYRIVCIDAVLVLCQCGSVQWLILVMTFIISLQLLFSLYYSFHVQ
jgi:hypothetical protein